MDLIDVYNEQRECVYKNERYDVRDNGSVFRHPKDIRKMARIYDNHWTFGKENSNGYLTIASIPIHLIVATAFHGEKPSDDHVVDHIDTNRKNNRPENLRWLTKLENVLKNEVTRKRIIQRCGSIEAFLANPSILQETDIPSNLSWMRTVSKAEAQVSKERLLEWARSDKQSSGGSLGEWVFQQESKAPVEYRDDIESYSWGQDPLISEHHSHTTDVVPQINYILSLTPGAAQIKQFSDDKPVQYPCTPQNYEGDPLSAYADNLKPGAPFWRNAQGDREYIVVKHGFSKDGKAIYVISMAAYTWKSLDNGDAAIPILINGNINKNNLPHSLTEIIFDDNLFIHSRPLTSFLPKEYIEEEFNHYISE